MFDKYSGYRTEDFVQDDYFIRWVNFPDRESELFWREYIRRFPEQAEYVRSAKQTVAALRDNIAESYAPGLEEEIWGSIQVSIDRNVPSGGKTIRWWLLRGVAAALVLAVPAAGWIYLSTGTLRENLPAPAREQQAILKPERVTNHGSTELPVRLPDSSLVVLSPGAGLSYPAAFEGKTREVRLEGEAFFDVRRDPEKPFMVYTRELVTKVLGTSFTIREDSQTIMVSVKTGKVSVFPAKDASLADPETKGLILKANQQADYSLETDRLTRSLVATPLPVIPPEKRADFNFTDAPVARVFEAIEAAYGVEIIYDKEMLKDCRLFSSLAHENLFEKLEVICEAIDASYKVVDAQIVVHGKKCR